MDCNDLFRVWISSTIALSVTCVVSQQGMQHPHIAQTSLLLAPMKPFLQRITGRQGIHHIEGILLQTERGMGCWTSVCSLKAEPERCVRENKLDGAGNHFDQAEVRPVTKLASFW